jgi:hypothetical protein
MLRDAGCALLEDVEAALPGHSSVEGKFLRRSSSFDHLRIGTPTRARASRSGRVSDDRKNSLRAIKKVLLIMVHFLPT